MANTYSTYILSHENNQTMRFGRVETTLRVGQPFAPSLTGSPVLAGGFPALSPETDFPLSPTLQLNGDLTDFDIEKLKKIAGAELERSNVSNFRSYTVEADKRICVLAADAKQLDAFIETYEGVLDIEPILLKASHPTLATTTDVSIDAADKGYSLVVRSRSPIHLGDCTYCGLCGISCPEKCISPDLHVDFGVCTYCRECEKACPTQAIDIYGVEERKINVPTIVVLDNTRVELPEQRAAIYTEQQLPQLFSTLFDYQIEEVVCHNNSICHYSGRLGIGCSRCFDRCTHNAITLGEGGVQVDHQRCQECGDCLAVCPTGALQYERFTDKAFLDYFRNLPFQEGSSLIIGNEKDLHKLWWTCSGEQFTNVHFLEHHNVSCLSLFHFLFLFSHGASRIVLLGEEKQGHGRAVLEQQRMANQIVLSLFDYQEAVLVAPVADVREILPHNPPHPLSRFYSKVDTHGRRDTLSSVLQFLVAAADRTVELQRTEFPDFAQIDCDSNRCTQCYACLNVCAVAALSADEQQTALHLTAGRCVGCGACATVCPEAALALANGVTLNEAFFLPQPLAQAEPMACKQCGKVFGTRKSFEKVMQILAANNLDKKGHLEYCDTCRVAKIYEMEA